MADVPDAPDDLVDEPAEWKDLLECELCGGPLPQPGALVFGPPLADGRVRKHHICHSCYPVLVGWFDKQFAANSDPFLASATPPEAPELLSPDELQALGVQKWLNAAYSPAPPEAPQQSAAELLPAENIALTVARAQVLRGEAPPPNTAAVLVMALDRLSGQGLWSPDAVAPTEADRP